MASSMQQRVASICLYITLATAWWVIGARAQAFFVNTGTYAPAAQSSATLTFYMHDNLDTSPSSAITMVPAVSGSPSLFGAIAVFDDALTSGPDPSSQLMGRGRGMYVFSSMDASNTALEFVWTMVFGDDSGYSGSTLSFKGYDAIGATTREITIVGGTGTFRMARGWADITTANANGGAAILKVTANVYYGV